MYERFYGLKERPFDLTPNPRYLLLTASHREALANLEYGIGARKGLIVVTGEAGTGKTTLLRRVLAAGIAGSSQPSPVRAAYLANPTLDRREFVEYMARALGLSPQTWTSKASFLLELENMLAGLQRDNASVALIIDEAQSLPRELLEEVRLLANIESPTHKLLPVVLVGQPELADRLNEPGLRQLKQRVALRCRLDPLDRNQTAAYIAHRISLAGGEPGAIFSREAVVDIYERSRGIPRSINVICDNALLTGFALDRRPIGSDVVAEVGHDFDLVPTPMAEPLEEQRMLPGTTFGSETEDKRGGEADAETTERRQPLRWRQAERLP
jgi:general secretion pathway protein A